MNKKFFLTTFCVGLMSQYTQAAAPHAGFFMGANVGHSTVDGKLHRTFNTRRVAKDKSNLGARSPIFGLFFGFGRTVTPSGVYLGGEVFGQIENFKAKREDAGINLDTTIKLSSKNTFGAVAKVGYVHKEMLFYGKVGAASTKWKLNYAYPATPFRSAANISTNPRKTGLVLGAGMDYAINKNWTLGGEYLYTMYKSVKLNFPATRGIVSGNFTHKPRVSTFNARLKYSF